MKTRYFLIYAIVFMALNTLLIIFNVIGSHGYDLYILFGTLWGLANVLMIKYATSVRRFALIIVGITIFDGFVDGFAHHHSAVCGDIAWLGPPWALPWDFFTYPYSHSLTWTYIIILWWIMVPLRYCVLIYFFVDHYTANNKHPYFTPENKLKNILIFIVAVIFFIASFATADHINFLLRGHIPDPGLFPYIDWHLLGHGILSTMHLAICLSFGIIIMILVFKAKIRSYGYIGFIALFFLLVRFGAPYVYEFFQTTIAVGFVLYLAFTLLVVAMFASFFIMVYFFKKKGEKATVS